jgi:hypothetical protein
MLQWQTIWLYLSVRWRAASVLEATFAKAEAPQVCHANCNSCRRRGNTTAIADVLNR